MLDARIRCYSQTDADHVYDMLQKAEELRVGGLTYSERAVQTGMLHVPKMCFW